MIFRNWVLQNFPFLEDDFDALTDYELFCKMMEYVKQFANDNEEFKKRIEDLETYVYNLNIQEAVNNKLDEMALDGTLENIISQYLALKITYTFNNIASMKAATNLIAGSFTKTNGFYSLDDKGGAYYYVRNVTNSDVVDEITIIALSDNNLVAELLITDKMSVKQFGAKGDGTNDDTDNIQLCLNNCKDVLIENGTYMIDASDSIKPASNTKIEINNATLKAIANNLDTYYVVDLDDVDNVIITGNGTVEGDKASHTGATGEWGHCIRIENESTNITIKDISLINGWGDGIYVGSCENVLLDNLLINGNRRNGISITDGSYVKVVNCKIINTQGTAPESAIDIEPNNGDTCEFITIENCLIKDNKEYGIASANSYYASHPNALNTISIINNKIINCKIGIKPEYINKLIISNNIINSNATVGINMGNQNDAIISNNNFIGNGFGISTFLANRNIIDNNIISNSTTTNPAINFQGSNYNRITNNKIYNNQRGINVTSTTTSGNTIYSSYNNIENNDIYDNSTGNVGTYNNISINNYSTYNVIKNNNFVGVNNNNGYNIYVGSSNAGTTNIIANNIMVTQTTGVNYLRDNSTLDNIIDGTLSAGNMRS